MTTKEIVLEVLESLDYGNYIDAHEHIYDGVKEIKRHLEDDDLDKYVNDFIRALESSEDGDFDGTIRNSIDMLKGTI